jgi:hypothetical protein
MEGIEARSFYTTVRDVTPATCQDTMPSLLADGSDAVRRG